MYTISDLRNYSYYIFKCFLEQFSLLMFNQWWSNPMTHMCVTWRRLLKFALTDLSIYRFQTAVEMEEEQNRRVGISASVLAHTAAPLKAKFCPSVMRVLLWRHGCPLKVFQTLNALGISQSLPSARGHVDPLWLEHDREIMLWKNAIGVSSLGWKKKRGYGSKNM